MKMKQINHIAAGFFLSLWCMLMAGCTQQEADELEVTDSTGKKVEVTLHITLPTLTDESGTSTRSTSSFTSDVENLIHQIRVCQYDDVGIRIVDELCYEYVSGQTQVLSVKTHLVEADSSKVVVFVNMEDFKDLEIPKLYNTLLQTKYAFPIASDITMVPMSGIISGSITEGQELRVTVARLVTRINLTLNNNTGESLTDVEVQLTNIPNKTYLCLDSKGREVLTEEDYTVTPTSPLYTDETTEPCLQDGSLYYYYYILPNYCSTEDYATQINISAKTESGVVLTYKKRLGAKAFDKYGSYTLEPNSIYSVTLNLMKK